ncbi:hypothetical protein Tco_1046723, partial [Tanacetum coccineum]
MKTKEPTYQVVLDALALTTCYPAFLITAEVPVIYMHQFWATIDKHKESYRFKIKNKRFYMNVEVFRDILNICSGIPGQEFDEPPNEEEALSFIREHGHSREIKYITNVTIYHLHQPWRTFASIINKCLCGKDLAYQIDNKDSKKQDKMFYPRFTKIIIHHFLKKDKSISMRNRMSMHITQDDSLPGTMRFISRHEDAQTYGAILPKAMVNQAMLDSVAYKTSYVIASGAKPPKSKKPKMKSVSAISSEETPSKKKPTKANKDVPSKKKPASKPKLTKKKAPVEADKGKGLNVLSEVALSKAAQLKEATKRSKKDFHISKASGSGDGTDFELGVPDEQQCKTSSADEGTGIIPGVPDVPKYLSESENESWGDSDADESNDDNSDEVPKDDDEDDVESDANDDNEEEEEKEDDDVRTPDSFEFNNDDEEYNELYMDVNVRSKVAEHEEVGKGDAEMTDTTHESSMQSSSVSSDFASKFLNLDNVSPVIDEVASMMNVKTPHEESSTQALLFSLCFTRIGFSTQIALQSYMEEFEKKAQAKKEKYIDIIEKSVKEIIKDESTINESLRNVVLAKSSSQPQSTYEDASSLTEFELKKIFSTRISLTLMTSKDADPSRGSKSKESKSSSSKGCKPQSKSSGKSAQAEEPVFETADTKMLQDQGDNMGNTQDQPNVEEVSKNDWFKKPKRPPTPDYDWNVGKQIEGHEYPFDLSKPLPLIEDQGRQVVPANYLFNNDLEYLKGRSSSGKYITSTIKTKDAKYDNIEGIEDMVQTLWSPVKIIVRREDHKLYKFKEGDFPRLNLRDIEDMLLLLHVEDLQLGVESYQKKLNITKPETFSKSENKGKVPTKMELVLELTQQGSSHEVLVSTEGVEELKRKVKIKSEKNKALLILRQKLDAPVMRTASAAAKPCQGDSSELYLII